MFDMRYHIASLVAVFLALAVGIMFGASIQNKGVIKNQQERLVRSIEKDVASIRKKNNILQKQLESQKSFESKVLPALIKEKLAGSKVGIIYFKDAKSQTLRDNVWQTLSDAGANVKEIPLDRKELLRVNTDAQEVSVKKEDKLKNIEQLAVELSSAPGAILTQLQENSKLELPVDFVPVNAVVIFAGGNKRSSEEMVLVKALKKNKIKVVFVDKSNNEYSKIEKFANKDIDTVDNIEMVYGKISLVYLLSDSINGHYGIKSFADDIMPALN